MEVSKQTMDGFHKTLIGLGVVFLAVFLPTLVFLAVGNQVGAAITGTLTACILAAISHVAAFAGGAWYTRGSMERGGDLVLRAQQANDRWDQVKATTSAKLMIEGARIGKSLQQPELSALPFPSQGEMGWMPTVSMLDDGEDGFDQD